MDDNRGRRMPASVGGGPVHCTGYNRCCIIITIVSVVILAASYTVDTGGFVIVGTGRGRN